MTKKGPKFEWNLKGIGQFLVLPVGGGVGGGLLGEDVTAADVEGDVLQRSGQVPEFTPEADVFTIFWGGEN